MPFTAALLLLSGAPSALTDVAPEVSTEIESRQLVGEPVRLVVVPTVENIPPLTLDTPATTTSEPPAEMPPSPDGIVVTARGEPPPGDPLQEVNITSYRAIQSVDKALVAPVATGYQGIVPEPVRDGLGNALRNMTEPVNFLNFLLQFKIGKAAETLGRFVVNTTFGVGGLFDVAKTKPFDLPYRRNGFANTLGFYGVEPGPYFYLPLVGPTTLRDMVGNGIDLLVVPTTVGAPFNRTQYAVPTTVIKQLNDRIENDAEIERLQEESVDPYAETRSLYLEMRQREIDALKGDGSDVAATPQAKTLISQTETLPVPEWPIVEEFIPIVTQPADGVPALPK
jgi:phospholipid-binding lipoprotein MlaA